MALKPERYVGVTHRQGPLLSHAGAQLMELPLFQTLQEKSSTWSCTGSEMFSLEVTHGGGVGGRKCNAVLCLEGKELEIFSEQR